MTTIPIPSGPFPRYAPVRSGCAFFGLGRRGTGVRLSPMETVGFHHFDKDAVKSAIDGASAIFAMEAGRDSLPMEEVIRPAEVIARQLDAILLDMYGHTLDEPGRRNLVRLITSLLAGYTAVITQVTRTAADALDLDPLAVLTAVENHLDAAREQFDGK